MSKYSNLQVISVRLPKETKTAIEEKARERHMNSSDLIREYITKGLDVDGYKHDLDFVVENIRLAVDGAMKPQIERLVKILMKIGKINGAGYFTQLANLISSDDKTSLNTLEETIQICNRMAIDYMNLRDVNVEKFLMDREEILRKAMRLKIDDFFSMGDIPDYE